MKCRFYYNIWTKAGWTVKEGETVFIDEEERQNTDKLVLKKLEEMRDQAMNSEELLGKFDCADIDFDERSLTYSLRGVVKKIVRVICKEEKTQKETREIGKVLAAAKVIQEFCRKENKPEDCAECPLFNEIYATCAVDSVVPADWEF